MRAEPIERIPPPPAEVFRSEFLRHQRPVIIQGLFANQPIDTVRTEEDAVRTFGSLQLPVQSEYLAGLDESSTGAPAPPRMMSLSEYLEFARLHPRTAKMCSEKPTPPELLGSFRLPDYDNWADAISSFFVGNAGNHAHLHFDLDFRHVLFYQAFGVKRFILIPPSVEKIPAAGNNSWWSIENFTEQEKREFVEFTGAYDCILNAGETLYIPAAIWHYVEYTTTSLSCNFRFGRNPYTRFLSSALHPSALVQNIAWMMADENAVKEDAFEEIASTYSRSYDSPREKYEALERILRDVCRKMCPGYPARDHGVANWRKLSDIYSNASEQWYTRTIPAPVIVPESAAGRASAND